MAFLNQPFSINIKLTLLMLLVCIPAVTIPINIVIVTLHSIDMPLTQVVLETSLYVFANSEDPDQRDPGGAP